MKKTSNIILASFLTFISLLLIAIFADYKRGVFNFASKADSSRKIVRVNEYNTTRKEVYNSLTPKNSKRINSRMAPSISHQTTRRLEGDELLHSNAKTAYFNYLVYSIKQNMPKKLDFPIDTSLWLIMDINRNGQVIAYDVYNYRGPEALKDIIISALKQTVPFQPIPEECQDDIFKAILVFSNGGKYIGQGSIYNPPIPQTKLAQKETTNTIKVTDVKLFSCNGSYPANLSQEMNSYINRLHKQINANWQPVITETSDVRLSYVIDKNGKVSDVNIGYSVASDAAENAAKNAVLSIKAPSFPESENLNELRLNHYFTVEENKIYN